MKLKKYKKLLITVTALVLVAAAGFGIWTLSQGGGQPVSVYSFDYLGMTEYWGDTQESYGPVSTDKIQTIFLSDTQTVTEVKVALGDEVKKGDILMTFDTTLTQLQLERKRLTVEKEKLQLDQDKKRLQDIKAMRPMQTPSYDFGETEPFLGEQIKRAYEAFLVEGHDGKTQETAFICWIKDNVAVSDQLLEELRRAVWGNAGVCEHGLLTEDCELCTPILCHHGNVEKECPVCSPEECEHGNIKALCEVCSPVLCRHGEIAKKCGLCKADRCEHDNIWGQCNICDPQCIHGPDCEICDPSRCEHGNVKEECEICNPSETEPTTADSLSAMAQKDYRLLRLSQTGEEAAAGSYDYYVVFKVTQDNYQLGTTTVWEGLHISGKGTDFSVKFFSPMIEDYTVPELEEDGEPALPEYDFGSGLTSAQIAEMRKEQEKTVKEQELKLKMAEAEYNIMLAEVGDGNIYAEIDGKVVSLLSEEEARQTRQPMMKVSGGGGFYIKGSVSELEKDNMQPGQEVTVNDWNNGMVYTGTVQEIGDFPSADGYWNGMGNPNTTYYPFTVFVGEEADLQAGSYASIMYSSSSSTNGIYLQNAFVRTEKGRSYVMIRGADGRLEKRFVTVGKSLYGYYTEILSGVTPEDFLAFPYGKDVKAGAPTVEGDINDLYAY